jgi:hypothetical protein
MDGPVIIEFSVQQPVLYALVLTVALLIHFYGRIIVPWLRTVQPMDALREEASKRPQLFVTSVFVAFLFPLMVGLV